MTKKENKKSPDQQGLVEHPERRFIQQRQRIRDLNESQTRKNQQPNDPHYFEE